MGEKVHRRATEIGDWSVWQGRSAGTAPMTKTNQVVAGNRRARPRPRSGRGPGWVDALSYWPILFGPWVGGWAGGEHCRSKPPYKWASPTQRSNTAPLQRARGGAPGMRVDQMEWNPGFFTSLHLPPTHPKLHTSNCFRFSNFQPLDWTLDGLSA